MKQPDTLNSVAEFHRTFGHPILEKPGIPDAKRCELRWDLLSEELAELGVAITQKDLVGVADALCDLQYVLSGAVLEFGLGELFNKLFNEVQRSNMSKACLTKEEADDTVSEYARRGVEAYYKESEGKFLVYRLSDNKILKSVQYSPARLVAILEG